MRIKEFKKIAILGLVVAEVSLVLISWVLSAIQTEGVQSLLSSEGIRWLFSSSVSMLLHPALVWILLLSMAGGCLWKSGILTIGFSRPSRSKISGYRERVALRLTLALLLLLLLILGALTLLPHAILLSSTGRLFPSPFSQAIVPVFTFLSIVLSSVYGLASGRFASFSDVIDALEYSIKKAAPVLILYIFLSQFLASLQFVF
jgi:aminobenzoyl-glutamate transport protein